MTKQELYNHMNQKWSERFMALNTKDAYKKHADQYKKDVTNVAWQEYQERRRGL